MELLKCQRCAHEWYQRTPVRPRRCAGCKALYWDRPARLPQPADKTMPRGKALRKYPIHDLEIGESVLLPFNRFAGTGQADVRKNQSMGCAILNYARRSGKTFKREVAGATGIRVTRLT